MSTHFAPEALPGHAIIGMKNRYADFEENLYIPRNAPSRVAVGRMGMVVSIMGYPEDRNSMVFVKGKLKPRPMYLYNKTFWGLLGRYVLCKNATLMYGELYDVRLENIQSVVPAEAMPSENELGRCRTCKSSGEGNILLGPDGFCPNCGFNQYGQHINEDAIDVSEDDIDHCVRIPGEIDHIMRTGGKAVTGRVISYPGQRNRGGNDLAQVNELNQFMKNRMGK